MRAVLVLLLFQSAISKKLNSVTSQKQQYEKSLSSSIQLEREHRQLLEGWSLASQVERVNVTTRCRVQVSRHKEHSFNGTDGNFKWARCLFLHRRQIRSSEDRYYAAEKECLTADSARGNEGSKAVEQLDKEIRKWRKGFRYLMNKCSTENPADEEASASCLVQNMERDNYSKVIERLMLLKTVAMEQLFLQLDNSLKHLEECLNKQLSIYLDAIRSIMETLNNCYSLTTQSQNEETE